MRRVEMHRARAPRQHDGDHSARGVRTPPKTAALRVLLYQRARYVAVCKPPDVRIDGDFALTVDKLVRNFLQQQCELVQCRTPYFVHRLDYATSGTLLMALSRRAAAFAAKQFETRMVNKSYVALVHGHVSPTIQRISASIASIRGDFRMKLSPHGRVSSTHVRVVSHGTLHGRKVSKLHLRPDTGRRHQLRLHCALLRAPIVGDATYGAVHEQLLFDAAPSRMMLHASLLQLRLPHQQHQLPSRARLRRGDVFEHARAFALSADDPFVPQRMHTLALRAVDRNVLRRSLSAPCVRALYSA